MPGIDSYVVFCSNLNTDWSDISGHGHTLTPTGAVISTAQKKWDAGSAYFDGVNDEASIPYHADFDMGSGNFTVDFWLRMAAIPADGYLMVMNDKSGGTQGWSQFTVEISTGNLAIGCYDSSMHWVNRGSTLSINTWYHIAGIRNGSTFSAYLDGISFGTPATLSGALTSVGVSGLLLGRRSSPSTNYANCYLDDLRISKGIARDPASFPPTAEYAPNVSYFVFLAAARRAVKKAQESFPTLRTANGSVLKSASLITARMADGVAPKDSGLVLAREALGSVPVQTSLAMARVAQGRLAARLIARRQAHTATAVALIIKRMAKARTLAKAVFDREVFAHSSLGFTAARQAHVRPGYHLYDVTTDINYLGFIAEGSTALSGLAFPPGVYTIEVRASRFFWEGARSTQRFRVEIKAAAPPEVWEIPRIVDLAGSIDGRTRRVVSWALDAANPAYRYDAIGVWFGSTSPVAITGEPTIRVSPTASLTYSIAYKQTAAQWVSVAALDGATRGPAVELLLPWDTVAPAAPGKLEVEAAD